MTLQHHRIQQDVAELLFLNGLMHFTVHAYLAYKVTKTHVCQRFIRPSHLYMMSS